MVENFLDCLPHVRHAKIFMYSRPIIAFCSLLPPQIPLTWFLPFCESVNTHCRQPEPCLYAYRQGCAVTTKSLHLHYLVAQISQTSHFTITTAEASFPPCISDVTLRLSIPSLLPATSAASFTHLVVLIRPDWLRQIEIIIL